jgi:hypothetical protein
MFVFPARQGASSTVISLKQMEYRNLLTHCLYGDSGIRQKDGGTGKTARSYIIVKVSGRENKINRTDQKLYY